MKRCVHIHVTMEKNTSLLCPTCEFQALNFRLIQVIFTFTYPSPQHRWSWNWKAKPFTNGPIGLDSNPKYDTKPFKPLAYLNLALHFVWYLFFLCTGSNSDHSGQILIPFTVRIIFALEENQTNRIFMKRDRNVTLYSIQKSGFKFVFYRLGLAHSPTHLATLFLLIEIYSSAWMKYFGS